MWEEWLRHVEFSSTTQYSPFVGRWTFQVLSRINDNAFKIELPGEYGVSATFNMADFSLFLFEL